MSDETPKSRSEMRREALQKGEEMPDFSNAVKNPYVEKLPPQPGTEDFATRLRRLATTPEAKELAEKLIASTVNEFAPGINEVCDHGSLRRKCEFCERDEEIYQLKTVNDAKDTEIKKLEMACGAMATAWKRAAEEKNTLEIQKRAVEAENLQLRAQLDPDGPAFKVLTPADGGYIRAIEKNVELANALISREDKIALLGERLKDANTEIERLKAVAEHAGELLEVECDNHKPQCACEACVFVGKATK